MRDVWRLEAKYSQIPVQNLVNFYYLKVEGERRERGSKYGRELDAGRREREK